MLETSTDTLLIAAGWGAAAMGISRDYEAGQAFDQDLQEERKAERIQQREHDQEKRERDRRQVIA